jgi:hypothetical protein
VDAGSGNFGPLGCPEVRRIVVAIDSYEGPRKKSESVEARYPDIPISDLRSAIVTSRKSGILRKRFLSSGSV